MSTKGYKHTKKAKIKIGKASKERKAGRRVGLSNKGRKLSETTRKKISIKMKKDGKHPRPYSGFEYTNWRMKVLARDNFTCLVCGKVGGSLEAHHIKNWNNYIKLRYVVSNGATLCKSCHRLIHRVLNDLNGL